MNAIRSAQITVLYLFDVASAIDVYAARGLLGPEAGRAKLDDKTAGPSRAEYAQPPVVADGKAFGCAEVAGFRVRVKCYDYGVISLRLSQPFEGDWPAFVTLGQRLIENEDLENHATAACRLIVERLRPALSGLRSTWLSEDYLVFAATSLAHPTTSSDLLERHGRDIAQLLRGERQLLSEQECRTVLGNAVSYLSTDLVVPTWNASFVYDTEAGASAAIEIFELANSQLLEYRYHDDLLESELSRIYASLQRQRWTDRFAGRRHTRAARQLQALFIDVNELTDRTENAVKFVGDIYAARLFGLVAARLGLDRWKRNVEDKLETLDDIYRFAVEQTGMSQANLLELVIVLILILELALFFTGVMT
ncbi:MAG: hypothetical protein AB7F99_10990 [Vicinamibacterales bacterium]